MQLDRIDDVSIDDVDNAVYVHMAQQRAQAAKMPKGK